jgi:hypothetical protein
MMRSLGRITKKARRGGDDILAVASTPTAKPKDGGLDSVAMLRGHCRGLLRHGLWEQTHDINAIGRTGVGMAMNAVDTIYTTVALFASK